MIQQWTYLTAAGCGPSWPDWATQWDRRCYHAGATGFHASGFPLTVWAVPDEPRAVRDWLRRTVPALWFDGGYDDLTVYTLLAGPLPSTIRTAAIVTVARWDLSGLVGEHVDEASAAAFLEWTATPALVRAVGPEDLVRWFCRLSPVGSSPVVPTWTGDCVVEDLLGLPPSMDEWLGRA